MLCFYPTNNVNLFPINLQFKLIVFATTKKYISKTTYANEAYFLFYYEANHDFNR